MASPAVIPNTASPMKRQPSAVMDAIPASKPDTTPVNDDPAPDRNNAHSRRPVPSPTWPPYSRLHRHGLPCALRQTHQGRRHRTAGPAAAEELNYSVNYAASSLRGAATNTIGLVIPSATDHFSAGLLDELEPVIDMERQQLLLGIGNEQHTQDERIESLVAARSTASSSFLPRASIWLHA